MTSAAEERSSLVVPGKADGGNWEVVGDSWEGDARGWRRIGDGDVAPRDHHSLVEDGRGGILMFGGIPADRSGPWPADTWTLQGDVWTRLATDGPPGRGRAALVYDSKRRRVVLFGGVSAPPGPKQPQTFFNDTWTWDGERWHKAADDGPRGRYAHGMVFDERAGVVLLYSGAAAHRDAPLSDMWQWDGVRWSEIRLDGSDAGSSLPAGHGLRPGARPDRPLRRHRWTERHVGVGRPAMARRSAGSGRES